MYVMKPGLYLKIAFFYKKIILQKNVKYATTMARAPFFYV